ncbi:MBL fold metallo-hydrolase [Plantactinospora mayteni]|uniref:MBL fold metallo-hydrolase n=1 Tax=Plantactinospora mayteni TaxID=566021 RepID=A0ABQ4F1Z8_9ACTN|nr:MBL fold metallo-hydrolase [Plantactinospora mayteni]GIH00937.1 MBL fold metallo-hydrolase [Plantactinospora mayteni]
MGVTQLHPQLYLLTLGTYQSYLWDDDGSATLIDTGAPGSGPAIADALRQVGLDTTAVDRLVLTHFHDDHMGSAAEVVRWGGMTVVAHASDAPVIRGEQAGQPPHFTEAERVLHEQVAAGLESAPPVRVDVTVVDGDILEFGGGATVVSTPGHTDGSIALYLKRHRILFTGDVAAHHEGSVIPGVFNTDRDRVFASFRRLSELDADVVCFGHGAPLLNEGQLRMRDVAARLDLPTG